MKLTREPAVAGMFYPADPGELKQMVDEFTSNASAQQSLPKALIVPHAGYIYSGPVAAAAYATLRPLRHTIRKVVLLGPSHYVALRGLAYCNAQQFATPLGKIEIDQENLDKIRDLPQVSHSESAHFREHSLEVQLPFLQQVLEDFKLTPLVVGEASAEEVNQVLGRLWGGEETLILISSDLSHYHDYVTAQQLDRATSQAIEKLDYQHIDTQQACGQVAVCGLLKAAQAHGLKATILDLRNSGDTAGSKDRVVGYGAYLFH